ncbi:hypothetical protein DQM28_19490 [Leptospira mayottensis]|uniref:Uncharacterized protein n=1 Tax=Leptospira mayottensis TaxID=1137606 RepID=A0ABM6YE11_9LEPT|nr:hypothetical protein DQM28_19490 [Leptospira mayottensis]
MTHYTGSKNEGISERPIIDGTKLWSAPSIHHINSSNVEELKIVYKMIFLLFFKLIAIQINGTAPPV